MLLVHRLVFTMGLALLRTPVPVNSGASAKTPVVMKGSSGMSADAWAAEMCMAYSMLRRWVVSAYDGARHTFGFSDGV